MIKLKLYIFFILTKSLTFLAFFNIIALTINHGVPVLSQS